MNDDLKKRCASLAEQDKLTPRALWESARDPSDPLHELFEWNRNTAAEKWRDQQARGYIAGIKLEVTVTERQLTVPAYVRDVRKEDNEPGYSSIIQVRKDGGEGQRDRDPGGQLCRVLHDEGSSCRSLLELHGPDRPFDRSTD